ncbi:MAG: tRNA lysidine(34) synthetase TilS [Hyphomicrobiaceae bacterium]
MTFDKPTHDERAGAGDPPVADSELARLFAIVGAARAAEGVLLAVSGGSDSIALLHLYERWRRLAGIARAPLIATVDHALRAGAAAEAAEVGARAAALGLEHVTLRWTGDKPRTGVQAAARAARYRLLAELARARGIANLVTAHTADDQGETLLMRLARGSGVDGLSAMAPASRLDDVRLLRPLLGVGKARLVATLRQAGLGWIEDPSNSAVVFERVRLRAEAARLAGIGLTPAALALSARRLGRARLALEAATDALAAPAARMLTIHPLGYAVMDRARLLAAPAEIAIRLLVRVLGAVGGASEPPRLSAVEDLYAALAEGPGGWTLARTAVRSEGGVVRIVREAERSPPLPARLEPGARLLWDGRFHVSAAVTLPEPVEIAPLGASGLRDLGTRGTRRPLADAPACVLEMLPAARRAGEVIAVPLLGFALAEAGISTLFDGERICNRAPA